MIKHTLKLDIEEREELLKLVKTGKSSAAKLTHARILLAADESVEDAKTDIEIAKLCGYYVIRLISKDFYLIEF